MIKKVKSSLFAKIFVITFLLTGLCCMATYGVISWLVPKTYSTTLDANLDGAVNSLLEKIGRVVPLESGKFFDEFRLNQNGVLVQLFDSSGNEIELPSQESSAFPVFVTGGLAVEGNDPAAYRATHSAIFRFAGSDEIYTLTVAGSAQEINLLKAAFGEIFLILLPVILLAAVLASLLYSRYVTGPVLRISAVSGRMSGLDFNWRCSEDRTDELGTLAHSLNEMSQRLSASMTDLKNANEKLRADIERERALEQAQLDFFSAASHELKTPVTVIRGQTEGMLFNIGDYRDRSKYLARSLEIINTMESMVQEILTVSRMKSSKAEPKKEAIRFSDMLKQEYALFEDLIVQKGIDWRESISPDLCVFGDKAMLQKAINNLVSNAVAYSPEDSAICLTACTEDGAVCLRLENTGVHIPDSELPRLFDAFYRVERSRNRKTGGSGLGLYIVKTILEQHQAEYQIGNTKRGVLFTIRFHT
ncbi:MAG: HAMP domain-containing sensor histidine kinase [Eubacteriales bacterium]|nr:HAMP domain-containing sensor histidine kinase [Eubacteriales bacterium]